MDNQKNKRGQKGKFEQIENFTQTPCIGEKTVYNGDRLRKS
jgi:DNA uptake protein ComE-like DNA-binding protein